MKIFLLIGMFSLCFIKVSGMPQVAGDDCEKTYTSLIVLSKANKVLSKSTAVLTKQLKKAKELDNREDVVTLTAQINKIYQQQIDLTNEVYSKHVNTPCLRELFDSKFTEYTQNQSSQKRLKKILTKIAEKEVKQVKERFKPV